MMNSLLPELSARERFLGRLRGPGNRRYARYNGLPLRYAGGKSLAVGYIIEQFPDRLERLVAPFIGGASVEIAAAKELGIPVQGYDVFDLLVNYWQRQLAEPERLADRIAQWEPSKAAYAEVKRRLKGHWQGNAPIADPLELAAHYWFNHNLSYGPGFLGWMSRIYEEPERARRLLDKVRTFRCPNLTVDCGSFADTIPQHRTDFCIAIRPTIWTATAGCFAASIPSATFRCITATLTTPCCGICCISIRAALSFPTTTAPPFGNGMPTIGSWKWRGNTPWARGKPALAKTAWNGATITM